jgi:hypothetical protein
MSDGMKCWPKGVSDGLSESGVFVIIAEVCLIFWVGSFALLFFAHCQISALFWSLGYHSD